MGGVGKEEFYNSYLQQYSQVREIMFAVNVIHSYDTEFDGDPLS